jgi:hypothetical protein
VATQNCQSSNHLPTTILQIYQSIKMMSAKTSTGDRPNHPHFLTLELSDEGHQELVKVDRWLTDNAGFVEQPELPAFQECQTEGIERAIWAFGEEVSKVIGVVRRIRSGGESVLMHTILGTQDMECSPTIIPGWRCLDEKWNTKPSIHHCSTMSPTSISTGSR